MLCAAKIELFGFIGSGIFSILEVRVEYSLLIMISCALLTALGSAHISTRVSFAPMPARLKVAATFTLAGNPFEASRALPSNSNVFSSISVRSISFSIIYGAPLNPSGGFVDAIFALVIPNSLIARTPSKPHNAPEGI